MKTHHFHKEIQGFPMGFLKKTKALHTFTVAIHPWIDQLITSTTNGLQTRLVRVELSVETRSQKYIWLVVSTHLKNISQNGKKNI